MIAGRASPWDDKNSNGIATQIDACIEFMEVAETTYAMGEEVRPRILLADDYPGLLTAWRALLTPLYDVVGEISDDRAVLEAAIALEPDVIVVDLSMLNGLGACRAIKRASARTRIVIVTAAVGDPAVAEAAFGAGASAFVDELSAYDDLPKALRSVLAGEEYCSTPFPG